ncbi:MAG: SDR family NAD(P)-dependent oxidoreductase [Solirubrobacterales bacterium]|nr:SDR family NAD(P)-dependent oxidoreductase [Solirubrobacterales bacterium]
MAGRPTQSGPRVIVITGAARGIGRATAATLAARGHRLILADLDGDLATEAAESIGCGAEGRALDVTDRSAFRELLTRVEADHGLIDVLINNAGIAPAAPRAVDEDEAMLRRTIDINLFGVMNGTLEAVRLMEPHRSGQVINIASVAGLMGVPGLAGYAASKWGVIGFTESIRAEMSGSGLAFTCVMPGPVATEMMAGTSSSPGGAGGADRRRGRHREGASHASRLERPAGPFRDGSAALAGKSPGQGTGRGQGLHADR